MQKTLAIQSAYWETLKARGGADCQMSRMEAWQKEREASLAATSSLPHHNPAEAPSPASGSIGDLSALSGMASLSMNRHRGGGGRPPLRHHSLNASTSGSEERESPDPMAT